MSEMRNVGKLIGKTCKRLLEANGKLSSLASVRDRVQARIPRRIGLGLVGHVMREGFGLEFREAGLVATRVGCVSCLCWRKFLAKFLPKKLMIGKRVIDIDEANFMEASFVRKAWGHRNQPLRPLKMPLGQSMSLIAAVDNYGASFFVLVH